MTDLSPFIEQYIKNFNYIRRKEKYKWIFLKSFYWDFDAPDFAEMVKQAFKHSENLLYSKNERSLHELQSLANSNESDVRKAFECLYAFDIDIEKRMLEFQRIMKPLAKQRYKLGITNTPQTQQSAHAISVYLFAQFPETYYMYKSRMFEDFTKEVEYHIKPKYNGGIINIPPFIEMCHDIEPYLFENKELMGMHDKWVSDNDFLGIDPENHLLTQDFIYAVFYHFKNLKIEVEKIDKTFHLISSSEIDASKIDVKEERVFSFKPVRNNDYFNNHKKQKQLGSKGESFVMEYEKKYLIKNGRPDLANKVELVSKTKGDGLGYDVLSFDIEGKEKFIEVKTTRSSCKQEFFVTANELEFSKQNAKSYWLYRVYDFNPETQSGKIKKISGNIENICKIPSIYSVILNDK